MILKNKLIFWVSKIFALPPLLGGGLLLYFKGTDAIAWGSLLLALGVIIFGINVTLHLDKEHIVKILKIYFIKLNSKVMDVDELESIELDIKHITNISSVDGSGGGYSNVVLLKYKHPEKYVFTAIGFDGLDINGFAPSYKYLKRKRGNAKQLEGTFVESVAQATGLSVTYSKKYKAYYY